MDSTSIIWSDAVFPLQLQRDLPKVVQVQDGYYDENEDMTLSNGDVLTLHLRKNLRTYIAVNSRGEEIRIPTTIAAKVQTIPDKDAKVYNSVDDMVKDGVEQVEWVHDTPWLNVQKGDIMQIDELEDSCRSLSAKMSFINKNQSAIHVPLNYRSDFKAVTWKTFWLGPGQEEQLQYPVMITFIDESLKINSLITDLGVITLNGFQETEVFIASIKDEDNRITVLKIPTILDITVRGGVGIEDDDYTYANVCQMYNRRARLEQLDEKCLDSIRVGNIDAAVERIYEVPMQDSDDESHEYIEPAPPIPTREGREPLHSQQSTDDDTDEYEEYDFNNGYNNNTIGIQESQRETITRGSNDRVNDSMGRGDKQHPGGSHVKYDPPENVQTGCCCFRINTKRSDAYSPPQNERIDRPAVCTSQPMRYVQQREIHDEENMRKDFRIPNDLRYLSTDEVLECLKYLNMGKHVDTFKNSQIDGELLVTLDEDMLEELGVIKLFEKRKLIKFIHGWRPEFHSIDT